MTTVTAELENYSLPAVDSGTGIYDFSFRLHPGDVCAIDSLNPDDAYTFMRALATLMLPIKGTYRFMDEVCDLKDASAMLHRKKKIGYVAPDAGLISNMTIRQNLLLQRIYHENRLDIALEEDAMALCSAFGIQRRLARRPSELTAMEALAAIIIREISKKPAFMIMGQPEEFIGHTKFDVLMHIFDRLIADRMPLVLLSYDLRLIRRLANRQIVIADGSLNTVQIGDPSCVQWHMTKRLRPFRTKPEVPGARHITGQET